jgi:hypothetical protein
MKTSSNKTKSAFECIIEFINAKQYVHAQDLFDFILEQTGKALSTKTLHAYLNKLCNHMYLRKTSSNAIYCKLRDIPTTLTAKILNDDKAMLAFRTSTEIRLK